MKKKYLILLSLGLSVFIAHNAYTNSGGAPPNNNGSPASNGNSCDRAGCHNGPAASGQTVSISTNIPSAGFKEDSVYQITVSANNNGSGSNRMAFMASVESTSGHEGTLSISDPARTRMSGSYVTHTSSGITGAGGQISWTFDWDAGQAPDQSMVYAAVNFSNQNGTTSGDVIVNQSLALDKNLGIGTPELAISKITAYPNPSTDYLILASDQALEGPFQAMGINGQMIELEAEFVDAQHVRLHVEDLARGIYLLKDGSANQIRFQKQ